VKPEQALTKNNMEEKRHTEQKILDVIEKNRSRVAVGFILLLVGSIGLLYSVLSGKTRSTQTGSEINIEVPTPSDVRVRYLDGALVPTGEEDLAPFAVMVENYPDAWPLSGVSKAQVVIEAPVEGGITRFMLLIDPVTDVSEIGPIRSARPYYVEYADSWHAFYTHVGGSPEGLSLIQTKDNLIDIDQFRYGNTFWRSILRFAPHNVYTSMELLRDFVTTNGIGDKRTPLGWQFSPHEPDTSLGNIDRIEIPYGGIYDVTWEYDAKENHFVRYQNGRMQEDKDGAVVTAKNVIVMETEAEVLDSVGRLKLRTTGKGDAIGFQNGEQYQIEWQRYEDEMIQFRADEGQYTLLPGTTWVEILTDEKATVTLRDDS